jgi:two-component system chemotaxis response regulator CheY
MLRDMLVYTLNDGGYSDIIEAKNGADGLTKAKNNHFDLIISDVNMPEMDGLSMVKEIKKLSSYQKTPILILTTERGEDMKQRGKEAGATGWIIKPFIPEQLLQAVSIVLNK